MSLGALGIHAVIPEELLGERRDDETYRTLVWQVDQKERNQQKT